MNKNRYLFILVGLTVAACGRGGGISNDVQAKTLQYYSSNPAEAKQVDEKCRAFQANEFSAMSPSKQAAWRETGEGINCKNAGEAYERIAAMEYQQRLLDASNFNFKKPAPPAKK